MRWTTLLPLLARLRVRHIALSASLLELDLEPVVPPASVAPVMFTRATSATSPTSRSVDRGEDLCFVSRQCEGIDKPDIHRRNYAAARAHSAATS